MVISLDLLLSSSRRRALEVEAKRESVWAVAARQLVDQKVMNLSHHATNDVCQNGRVCTGMKKDLL